MAIYMCDNCNEMHDDDKNPGIDVDGELFCEDSLEFCEVCDNGFQEVLVNDDEYICQGCHDKRLQEYLDHKDSMEAAAEDFNDDKRRGL